MKKLFVALFFFLALLQCKSPEKRSDLVRLDTIDTQVDSVKTDALPATRSTAALDAYQTQLSILPRERQSIRNALRIFKNKFSKPNPLENDRALKIFLTFQRQLIDNLNDSLLASPDYESINSLIWVDTTKYDDKGKAYKRSLVAYGLALTSEEGSVYLKLQPSMVNDYFYSLLSQAGKAYLSQFTLELNEGLAEDGGLTISIRDVANRLGAWNNFETHYPTSVFYDNAINEQKFYLYTLLAGMDNTQPFDYDSKKIDERFLEAYRYYVKQYPLSKSAIIIHEYLKLLSASGFKNRQLDEFAEKYSVYK